MKYQHCKYCQQPYLTSISGLRRYCKHKPWCQSQSITNRRRLDCRSAERKALTIAMLAHPDTMRLGFAACVRVSRKVLSYLRPARRVG